MLEVFEQLIDKKVEPLLDKVSELETETEDLKRLVRGLIKFGNVSEHSEDKTKIKVKHGDNETPFIKWFSVYSGEVAEWRLPSIGEQVVLLNIGGGDNSSMSLALCGIASDAFPLPSTNPDETLRKYPDGTTVAYNHKQHKLTIAMQQGDAKFVVPDSVLFDTKLLTCTGDIKCNKNIKADGDITDKKRSMQAGRELRNKQTHPHGNPNTGVPNEKE